MNFIAQSLGNEVMAPFGICTYETSCGLKWRFYPNKCILNEQLEPAIDVGLFVVVQAD